MTPRSMLPHPLSILLLLVVTTMPGSVAYSQDRAVQERLDRLERDLSMLQRQVYRGSPSAVVGPGSSAAVDVELRMDRLETQMRDLTGRVEDAVNGVEQLQRRMEQINSDIDTRFSQAQAQPRGAMSDSHASASLADSAPTGTIAMRPPSPVHPGRSNRTGDLTPPGTLVPPPPDPGPATGGLSSPGPSQFGSEIATAAPAAPLRPRSTGALPAGSASEQYNIAFGLLKQANYSAAEDAFKAFIAQHPKDPLASSAQYWLGESYYERGRYTEAASAYAEGYKNYPKGSKAPDDLLKLAMSLAHANQKQNACVALAQLDRDFRNPGSAIRDQAAKEKKRLGC
ncbi:MAG TPA: tol-pal system protein YbgF [Stellaceae bacterium]|nr:tol-pal system protein YbgF [Stellaceae bacterium]